MLGLMLARMGIDVVVLEKHMDFLRDFRGDDISPGTIEILGELGLAEDFLSLKPKRIETIRAHPTALKNPELWLLVSGFWLMVTRWLQVDSGIVMASGSP